MLFFRGSTTLNIEEEKDVLLIRRFLLETSIRWMKTNLNLLILNTILKKPLIGSSNQALMSQTLVWSKC